MFSVRFAVLASRNFASTAARCLLLCLLILLSRAGAAQTGQGTINGRVSDKTGALVVGAQVTVTEVNTLVAGKILTNQAGVYSLPSLNPGTYRVEVTASGFEREITDGILVSAAETVEINVKLSTGNESITVTVTSQDSLLQKVSDVSTTVDHELVENLPYPERSALEAVLLIPGIDGDPTQPGGISTENPGYLTGQVTPGGSLRIGGAPPGTHAHLIDGSDVTQSSYGRSGVNLSGRAVQETTAITSGMSAKYGRTGSGVLIQTSRTGTDKFHGAVSWRHTDPFFNAYPLGGAAPNNNHQNLFGFYLNGPVYIPRIYKHRDKTFFNVGIEPARHHNTVGVRGSFFTPDELAGHLNNSLTLIDSGILSSQGYAAAVAAPRKYSTYYHSLLDAQGLFPAGPDSSSQYKVITGPLADCGPNYAAANPAATSCPNDLAPQLALNPFATFVLSQFPTPANPGPYVHFDNPDASYDNLGTNANYDRGVYNFDNRYNLRVDHQIGPRSQMFVRYTAIPIKATRYFAIDQSNPLSQSPEDDIDTRNLAIGFTQVLSNKLVGNFRYSFLRVNQQRKQNYSSLSADFAGKYGLTPATGGKGFPNLGAFDTNGTGYTMKPGSLTGFVALDQNFVTGGDFNYVHGNHLFQFGGEFRWIQSNQYDLSGATGGTYSFSNSQTGNGSSGGSPLATFILGTISSFKNSPQPVPEYYRWRYYAIYLQDDWRVSARLTAHLGMRYNVETPRMEKFNNQGSIVLQSGLLNGIAAAEGFCFSGTCGLQNTLWPTNHLSFEPRVGLSYALNQRTVLRAAYALSHLPLSGYGNLPRTNLNTGTNISSTSGGTNVGSITNYVSNPAVTPTAGYALFNAQRGSPTYSSNTIAPDFVNQTTAVPYIQSWAASVQFQPAPKSSLQLSYQGSKGTHLIGSFSTPTNAPSIPKVAAAIQSSQYLGSKYANPYGVTSTGQPGGPVITETGLQGLVPNQNFFNQDLLEIYPRHGSLHYNAFYASFNQRLSKHVTFLAHYQWSKTLDNIPNTTSGTEGGSGVANDQDAVDTSTEWSLASYDYPSRLRVGFHVQLPIGRHQLIHTGSRFFDNLIGNITTSGLITSSSGHPNTVTLGTSGYFYSVTPSGTNGCTTSGTSKFCSTEALPNGYTLRPNRIPGVPVINSNWKQNPFGQKAKGPLTPYLNPAAFTTPGSQGNPQFGNSSRTLGNGRTPREFFFDARVAKSFRVGERYQLRVTATSNNVLNHPAYFQVSTTSTGTVSVSNTTGVITPGVNGSFGNLNQGTSASLSRTVHIGAEFVF